MMDCTLRELAIMNAEGTHRTRLKHSYEMNSIIVFDLL